MKTKAANRLIVALDAADLPSAVRMAKRLQGVVRYVKIGSILFTAEGPQAVRRLRRMGFEVFLDLKFHDIPSTVGHSCQAAVRHGVWMLTVHASGQSDMLNAAATAVRREARRLRIRRPLVVGVTVLTSVDGATPASMKSRVVALAREAKRAGLDGVVCSVHEARAVRRRFGQTFTVVCPGIRAAGSEAADQRRVATPAAALRQGASFLVVGRPITQAADPRRAAQQMLDDMEDGC